jgi:hypothetical protein
MSLEIYINTIKLNIPDKQTIAYNLANFEITDLANRKLTYTNNFLIPAAGNELAFGFSGNIASAQSLPYTQLSVDVFADGIQIITDGSAFIQDFSDGFYSLQVTDNKDLIQQMRDTPLSTLYAGVTVAVPGSAGGYGNEVLLKATTGFKMDVIMNDNHIAVDAPLNLYNWTDETDTLSVFIKTVFQRYETVNSVTFAGDLWTDAYFVKLRMNVFYALLNRNIGPDTSDIQRINLNPSKSFYDLFRAMLQIFGSTYKTSGSTITFSKLDNIDLTTPVDWSGKATKINSKLFAIPNTGQKNYFRYSAGEGTDKTMNQSVIASNNLNLPFEVDLMTFDATVYPLVILDMYALYTDQETVYWKDNIGKFSDPDIHGVSNIISRPVSEFVFMIDSTHDLFAVSCGSVEGGAMYTPAAGEVFTPTYFNSQNEYTLLTQMLTNPVFYDADMWLGLLDVTTFDNMKVYKINELGGIFYVNSIKGYLLNSVDKTAQVELIKLS